MIPDDEFRPEKINENNLKIFDDTIMIPLNVIGCSLTADEILKEWQLLEDDGFPLTQISRLFVALEAIDRNEGKFFFLPMSIHLIKIVDGIHGVRSIEGGSVRINKLRKELSRLIFNVSRGPTEQKKIANLQIVNTIFSYSDEFQIGYMLHKLYPSLKFNRELGPDFWLDTLGIKAEAKSKLNRKYLGYISDPTIQLDKTICLKLLSKDVFEAGRLENAFEHQETDIAIMNLSHSQFGSLFASYAFGLDNLNFELSEALTEAIDTVSSKDKAAILYSEQ